MHHHFGSEYDLGQLTEAIRRADFIVAHNAKFELGWLKRCGIDLRKVVVFDTMIAEYVLGGNRFGLHQLSLTECLKRHGLAGKLDLVSLMIKGGVPVPSIPQSWLRDYCERDVEATGELFLLQRKLLKREGLEAINYQRCLVTPALADIEFNGMQLDCDIIVQRLKEEEQRYAQLTTNLQTFCEGASPASPKQMREFIFDTLRFSIPTDHRGQPVLTPSGTPSVAAEVVDRLVPTTKRQRDFVALRQEWAQCHSNVTKYLRKFAACCEEDDGRLRASFNQRSNSKISTVDLSHSLEVGIVAGSWERPTERNWSSVSPHTSVVTKWHYGISYREGTSTSILHLSLTGCPWRTSRGIRDKEQNRIALSLSTEVPLEHLHSSYITTLLRNAIKVLLTHNSLGLKRYSGTNF
jgi:DNA polymerase I-like protein with 3'-5' exonuclease and polymerase domains